MVNADAFVGESALTCRRSKRLRAQQQRNDGEEDAQKRQETDTPLLRVGLLADIQYAPIPDGTSFTGTPRYYQNALSVAKNAAKHFERENLPVVLNLGDIVDGKCQDISYWGGEALPHDVDPGLVCTDHVLEALSPYCSGQMIHAYGNHCLYNMDRESMAAKLGIPFVKENCGELVGYYSVLHDHGIRFVVLDCYDIAKMRRPSTSTKYQKADTILKHRNPNYKNNENSPEGLQGLARRFVAFNGGVGATQLVWLQETLKRAREAGERVVIVSHLPLMPGSSGSVCLLWNHAEVLKVLREYRDVVALSLSGHAHKGGYRRDPKSGIHFRVVEAVLENPHPMDTYAVMDIFEQKIKIHGFGNCDSAEYAMDHLAKSTESKQIPHRQSAIGGFKNVE